MNKAALLFLFFNSWSILGFCSKLPDDILTSNCILGIQCRDEEYEEYSGTSLNELKSLGLKIDYCYHINNNPTLRKKRLENSKQEIEEKKYTYKYIINIGVVFDGLSNTYVYVLIISKSDEKELIPSDYCYMTRGSSLEKLFKNLNNKLK